MQDGTPCHRSNVDVTSLAKNRVKVLDWPGNSPDLNPIDNLWTEMKDKVAEIEPPSAKDLVKANKRSVDEINLAGVQHKLGGQYAKAPAGGDQKRLWTYQTLNTDEKTINMDTNLTERQSNYEFCVKTKFHPE